ncbi:MAG: carbohydrate-binding protein [Clostridia bacterium]|nr:carbohydrate-binding protein [Clostridia bacterium]
MVQIKVVNQTGSVLREAVHPQEALACVDRDWEQGDAILFLAPAGSHLEITVDASMLRGEVYLPNGIMHWPVPLGEHRLAYTPGLFEGKRHIITARLLSARETAQRRDLARTPLDLRGETDFFPHCSANVETRNESVFAARNVIDGLRFNQSHGEWPYESWGIGAREDAWCLLNFGREVIAEKMALTLRADFPHDAYWVSGHVTDSNGDEMAFELQKTGERQMIDLGGRRVQWLRLERMVKSDDPSAFPSLRAWEVFGYDPANG